MMNPCIPFMFLPGGGNQAEDLSLLRSGPDDPTTFEILYYPGWRRYLRDDFSPETLIDELAAAIAAKIPQGPIRLLGLSIGGHFGYAAALKLLAKGRDIGGFCAIDSFMIESEAPSSGWKGRALGEALELLRKGRLIKLIQFMRSKFWRAALRLERGRLLPLFRRLSKSPLGSAILEIDSVLAKELSMRLLIRATATWLASLDHNPSPLRAPAVLLRTSRTSSDDPAWLRRCPEMKILDVAGGHQSLFEPEYVGSLRKSFLSATSEWH